MSWPPGTGRIVLDRTDSTNAEAMRRAGGGEGLPFWLLARDQTAGRGRRGRGWAARPGNFYASLAMAPDRDPAKAALRSFVAALALHDTLAGLGVDPMRLSLKWPNDVLVSGRKVAGILLESTAHASGLILVVGIGVNLAAAPAPAELEPHAVAPVALTDIGLTVEAEGFLDRLAPAFAAREATFTANGFAPIRDAWLSRAARLGEAITAHLPDRTLRGTFETVDDHGALVLNTGAGRTHIAAADVFF